MPRRTTTRTTFKAEIGRFDGELKVVAFKKDDTVQKLLDKAGINFSEGEEINDEAGNTVLTTDKAKANGEYYITGNYKNGM